MSQAWTLSIVERVARKAACPAHGDTLRVCTRPRSRRGVLTRNNRSPEHKEAKRRDMEAKASKHIYTCGR